MRVLISVDIEGVSGIANVQEVWAREAITDDTNAAIEGALAGGATESGDINKIKVVQDGRVVTKNLSKELAGDTPIEKFGIQSGDQIVVGKKGGLSVRDRTLIVSMVTATALVVDVLRH